MFEIEGIKFTWLGHAGFRIEAQGLIVYIDPYQVINFKNDADFIFVTHGHYDHKSIGDINRLKKDETFIILPESEIKTIQLKNIIGLKPDQRREINTVTIETVPAYNNRTAFHPRKNNWLGYVITLNNKRIYHSGDTDYIIEMRNLKNIDIALLPVGGTYTMTGKDAADAVNAFKPRYAVPMHWGSIVGSKSDADALATLVKNTKVIIPK